MLANAGYDVLQLSALRSVIEDVIDRNKRKEGSVSNIDQPFQTSRVVPAIEHADRKPNRPWRGPFQPDQERTNPFGMESRRRHDNKIETFNIIQKVRQPEKAVAFFSSALSQRKQPSKPSPTSPVTRIGKNIGCSIGENQSRTNDQLDFGHRLDCCRGNFLGGIFSPLLFFLRESSDLGESAHDTSHTVAVGNADACEARSLARSTSSSGEDAPRKKEKLVVTANSA